MHRIAPLPVVSTGPASLHQYLDQAREGERGEERYYTEEGRAASEWRTSPGLEIDGPVTAGQFVRLLDGEDPVTGADRLDERSARRRLAGWSGVLAAPPEVSFLIHHGGGHLLADGRDVGEVARGCWEGAVGEALAGIEGRLGTRAGAAGSSRLDAVGWQVALFRHETNRDGWLHSHVHYILPNCVQGSDGVWRTVDSRRLVPVQKVIGAELQAALRRRFSAELGLAYDLTRAKDGIVPAAGVDDRYVEARSSRRRAIGRYLAEHREALAERGIVGRRAELYAERATRAPKDTTVPIGQLRAQERDRLEALGVDIDTAVEGLVGRAVERTVDRDEVKRGLFERLAGPDGLTGHRAVFAERDVLVECLAAAPTPADATVWAEEFVAGWALPARSPSGEAADRWFTTVSLLDAQDRVRDAWEQLDRGRPLASDRAVDLAIDGLAGRGVVPSRAQEAAVRAVCSASGPVVVEGPPGCGKTSVVAAAVVAAARHDRINVVGSALALEAASLLGADTGLADHHVHTLAGLLARSNAEGPGWFANTLVLVDEASMLGTRQAAELFGRIASGGGRLVLLGDGRQAPPVEAGGVWPTLCDDAVSAGGSRYVRLTEGCRQQDPAEREAVALLRAGRISDALHHWNEHGRIVGGDSDDQVIAHLATRAAAQIVAGEDVLVLAATRDEAERAGFAIRTRLLHHGHLDGGHVQYGTLPVAGGDRVVLRANNRALGARNGTRGTIHQLTPDGITVVTAGGRALRLPAGYVAEHVDWAYALTVHTGQGQTADHVHVLASPSLYQELAVVAGSRHRHTVTWHLSAGAAEHLRGPESRPTVDDLARWAAQPRAERFAHLEPEPLQPSLADLYDTRDQAVAVLVEYHQMQRAVDHAARDRAIVQGRLDQLRTHRTGLEQQRRRAAARTVQLPQRPLRRTTRHALQHAHQDLDRADHDLVRNKADLDKVAVDLERVQTRLVDARRHLDDHQPQAAEAKRNALHAELAIANRTRDLGTAAADNQPRHVIELLGPPPPGSGRRDHWIAKAGAVEAYRERWGLPPETITHCPDPHSTAYQHWRQVMAPHLDPQLHRHREHDGPSISR